MFICLKEGNISMVVICNANDITESMIEEHQSCLSNGAFHITYDASSMENFKVRLTYVSEGECHEAYEKKENPSA